MDKFMGRCVAGPMDGQMLAHWSNTYKLLSPMMTMPTGSPAGAQRIVPVEIGEYRLNDFGQWHWWETEVGRALNVLAKERCDAGR